MPPGMPWPGVVPRLRRSTKNTYTVERPRPFHAGQDGVLPILRVGTEAQIFFYRGLGGFISAALPRRNPIEVAECRRRHLATTSTPFLRTAGHRQQLINTTPIPVQTEIIHCIQ